MLKSLHTFDYYMKMHMTTKCSGLDKMHMCYHAKLRWEVFKILFNNIIAYMIWTMPASTSVWNVVSLGPQWSMPLLP